MQNLTVYRFYYEIIKVLKRYYNEHPENCPFPDFGVDPGKYTLSVNYWSGFERYLSQEYKNEVKKKEQEI